MSTPNPNKNRLLKNTNSPFQKLAARTVETGNEALREARQINIELIDTNPRQPRRTFNAESLEELAQDIKARGILQPLIVRPIKEGQRFEIVVGERRYQAAKLAGEEVIPVLVRELDDQQAEVTSLIENIQREDLSLGDEASYFKMLQAKYDYSIRDIASNIAHKSHSYVEVRLKLADNPAVLEAVQAKVLGLQEANQLMREDPKTQRARLEQIKLKLQNAQSVFSKDNTLHNSQSGQGLVASQAERKEAKETGNQPFLAVARSIKAVAKRLERLEMSDKQVVINTIEELEQEIVQLKRQLKIR